MDIQDCSVRGVSLQTVTGLFNPDSQFKLWWCWVAFKFVPHNNMRRHSFFCLFVFWFFCLFGVPNAFCIWVGSSSPNFVKFLSLFYWKWFLSLEWNSFSMSIVLRFSSLRFVFSYIISWIYHLHLLIKLYLFLFENSNSSILSSGSVILPFLSSILLMDVELFGWITYVFFNSNIFYIFCWLPYFV